MTLDDIGKAHGTDKSSLGHCYLDVYAHYVERFASPARAGVPFRLLEIGIAGGASMRTWVDYFGGFDGSEFVGVDHNPESCAIQGPWTAIQGDAHSAEFWRGVLNRYPDGFDIIIDDGGHHAMPIITTMDRLWPAIKPAGIFILEDCHCGYRPEYNAGQPAKDCTEHKPLRHVLTFVDRMNSLGEPQVGKPQPGCDIAFVHFYRSLAIIGKRK